MIAGRVVVPEEIQRRLTAIFAADMVGYSRLMQLDEDGTITRQRACRAELIDPEITNHNGRIVKVMGDGLLVAFASAIDAVACAVRIQRAMPGRNKGIPDDKRMEYRIGINLGDVVIDGDDILGDGVNVAARLEPLANPGGICISDVVYRSIKGKLDLGYAELEPQRVKNIREPVTAYHVLLDPSDKGRLKKVHSPQWQRRPVLVGLAFATMASLGASAFYWHWPTRLGFYDARWFPDRPSIAVLPLKSLSDDKEQEYFADGVSEDIIIGLTKISGLFVIAYNSTAAYKDRSVSLKRAAQELGVRNILTGSVRRSADKIRITAELVDTFTGRPLWGEQFDRQISDIFAIQSEIGERVVKALSVTLKANEQERLFQTHAHNIQAYELFLKARKSHLLATPATLRHATKLYSKIVELDPAFAGGYAGLSVVLTVGIRLGFSTDPSADAKRALELANKAVSVDPEFGWSYIALGGAYIALHDADSAVTAVQHAVDIQPNDADALLFLGFYKSLAGLPESGIKDIKASMKLDPKPNNRQYFFLGNAYYANSEFDMAVTAFKKWDELSPNPLGLILLAASYAMAGDSKNAIATVDRYMSRNPGFKASTWGFAKNYKLARHRELILTGLRKAGFPNAH